jgi:hypothetical protein
MRRQCRINAQQGKPNTGICVVYSFGTFAPYFEKEWFSWETAKPNRGYASGTVHGNWRFFLKK